MTPMQPLPPDDAPLSTDDPAPWLSALADGQRWAVPEALRHWRDDAAARRTWHAYQLIGDAMRSDELARPAAHDRALLDRVRRRLDEEPVVLAPSPAAVPASVPASAMAMAMATTVGHGTRAATAARWAVPAGLAASLVLGAAWVLAPQGDLGAVVAGGGPVRAVAAAPQASTVVLASAAVRPSPAVVGGDHLIRDPRLEEFLRVHQSARGGVANPGGGLRRVDAWAVSSTPRPAAP